MLKKRISAACINDGLSSHEFIKPETITFNFLKKSVEPTYPLDYRLDW
jgi:hypothetical protein